MGAGASTTHKKNRKGRRRKHVSKSMEPIDIPQYHEVWSFEDLADLIPDLIVRYDTWTWKVFLSLDYTCLVFTAVDADSALFQYQKEIAFDEFTRIVS